MITASAIIMWTNFFGPPCSLWPLHNFSLQWVKNTYVTIRDAILTCAKKLTLTQQRQQHTRIHMHGSINGWIHEWPTFTYGNWTYQPERSVTTCLSFIIVLSMTYFLLAWHIGTRTELLVFEQYVNSLIPGIHHVHHQIHSYRILTYLNLSCLGQRKS